MFTIRRVAIVEHDRAAAEMLHTFFRLMELECSLVSPDSAAVPTLRRLAPDIVILDLDLPDLRALEIAKEIDGVRIVMLTDFDVTTPSDVPVLRKPRDSFEELLTLFEVMLALSPEC